MNSFQNTSSGAGLLKNDYDDGVSDTQSNKSPVSIALSRRLKKKKEEIEMKQDAEEK